MEENKKNGILVILIQSPPVCDEARPSRALYLFNYIRKKFPETFIIMQDENKGIRIDNLILVKPILPITGNLVLLKGILFRLKASLYIIYFVIKNNIKIVIVRGYDNCIYLPILKLFKIKIIYDFHGLASVEQHYQNRHIRATFVKIIETIILKLSDKILIVSNGVKEQISWAANKSIYLPNGIDLKKIASIKENNVNQLNGKKTIGFIGNSEDYMQITDICEAVKYVDNCIAIIIGWGKDISQLKKKYEASDKIWFTGRLPPEEAYAILKRCDIFVLPYSDCDDNSKIPDFYSNRKTKEYIAIGKPIVVADIIGKEKVLINGKNCLYYVPGDPEDLAKKITVLLNNRQLYLKLQMNIEALAPGLTWENIIMSSGLLDEIAVIRKL